MEYIDPTIEALIAAVNAGDFALVKKLLAGLSRDSKSYLADYGGAICCAVTEGDCPTVLALVDAYISIMHPKQIKGMLHGGIPPNLLRWMIIRKSRNSRIFLDIPENIKSMFLDNVTKLDPVQIPEEKKK
jgi:hypothetical protein